MCEACGRGHAGANTLSGLKEPENRKWKSEDAISFGEGESPDRVGRNLPGRIDVARPQRRAGEPPEPRGRAEGTRLLRRAQELPDGSRPLCSPWRLCCRDARRCRAADCVANRSRVGFWGCVRARGTCHRHSRPCCGPGMPQPTRASTTETTPAGTHTLAICFPERWNVDVRVSFSRNLRIPQGVAFATVFWHRALTRLLAACMLPAVNHALPRISCCRPGQILTERDFHANA